MLFKSVATLLSHDRELYHGYTVMYKLRRWPLPAQRLFLGVDPSHRFSHRKKDNSRWMGKVPMVSCDSRSPSPGITGDRISLATKYRIAV